MTAVENTMVIPEFGGRRKVELLFNEYKASAKQNDYTVEICCAI